MNVTIERARTEDRWAMLDFANLVFSQAYQPHDFRKLLPKMYAEGVPFENTHYLAKEDGHITGLVSALPYDIHDGGDTLKTAFVGTVSTHSYCRGSGYMKACMKLMHEDMEAQGAQLFVLSGRRQRYGYYGYSKGLAAVAHDISPVNVEKAMAHLDAVGIRFEELDTAPAEAVALHEAQGYYCWRDPEKYADILRSWKRAFFRIVEGDKTLGFCATGLADIELYDEDDLLRVVKAWVLAHGAVRMSMGILKTKWNRLLGSVSEESVVENSEMLRVVDWAGVAEFFLKTRARHIAPLQDGEFRLGIEGEGALEIVVKDGVPACRMTGAAPDLSLPRVQAQEFLFSTQSLYLPQGVANWLPLPAWIPVQDTY